MTALQMYKRIGIVVFPSFMQQLTMLSATLESKVEQLQFMKAKLIAASVSLFITGAPVVVRLIYRYTGFEDAS